VTFHLADSLPKEVLARIAGEVAALPEEEQAVEQRKRAEAWVDAGHGSCVLRVPVVARKVEEALLFFDGERYRMIAWVVMPNHVHALFEPVNGWTVAKIVASWKKFTARVICGYRREGGEEIANREIGVPRRGEEEIANREIGVPRRGEEETANREIGVPRVKRKTADRGMGVPRGGEEEEADRGMGGSFPGNANLLIGRAGNADRVWHREFWDRYIRDERHLALAVAYIHGNPVKAGLVEQPEEWPWGSARRVFSWERQSPDWHS